MKKSSTTADDLAAAEQKVADLTAQIDGRQDWHAERQTQPQRLPCSPAKMSTTQSTPQQRRQRMLRALEAARATTNEKVVVLRKQHAEEESFATRQAAKPVMYKVADALDAAEAEIMPLWPGSPIWPLKATTLSSSIAELAPSPESTRRWTAVRGPMKMLAGQLRGSADAFLVPDEHGHRLATAKRALAIASALKL